MQKFIEKLKHSLFYTVNIDWNDMQVPDCFLTFDFN